MSVDDSIQNRVVVNKVTIETPALLNMIKHCQDNRLTKNTHGYILGVIKKELVDSSGQTESEYYNNLYVTSILQDDSIRDLRGAIERDSVQKETNNQVGFYVSCELGLAFTYNNLILMML